MEWLKVILIGIVEGITEWLPISSTGHMLLLDQWMTLNRSDAFKEMFFVVIQLGAILAVVTLYFHKLNPFAPGKDVGQKKDTWSLWFKVAAACVPSVVFGVLFDEILEKYLYTPLIIACALIFYGILFIVIENWNKRRTPSTRELSGLTYQTAICIGLFQVLAMIPGTSRSGATIIGAMLLGTSRTVAAEFTFFLAIPTMVGASLLKLMKFGLHFSTDEVLVLITGMVTAFVVSVLAIKFLMGYIKKHNFKAFGWYRIVLGVAVIAMFAPALFR